MATLFFILGLGGLFLGAEWLVRGSSSAAFRFGISPLVVGLTVVAFGTSSPELGVSLGAALSGKGDISLGNVIGSNIANIALILGVAALIRPIRIHRRIIRHEIPIMLAITLVLLFFLLDQQLNRWEGFLLCLGLVVYLIANIRVARRDRSQFATLSPARRPIWQDILLILGGLALLSLGSMALVSGATTLARHLGISEAVIGLTIVALGTSLPELATSIAAAYKGEGDIAVGNVIGSNILNILAILGLSALIHPLEVANIGQFDRIMLLLVSLLVLPLMATRFCLNRWEGLVLLFLFTSYIALLFVNPTFIHF